jgi:dipeptidyl aminopeptidase/acylaminoacyl peptidase
MMNKDDSDISQKPVDNMQTGADTGVDSGHGQNYDTDYGNWPSEITSELIVSDSVSIDEARLTATALYYVERRPQEKGRCVIVRNEDGISLDVLPAPYSARSRVHEYGGGCYCLDESRDGDRIFFVNDSDQDIYLIEQQQVHRITDEPRSRFADFSYDRDRNRLIAVREVHARRTRTDARADKLADDLVDEQIDNTIVSIDIESGEVTVIAEGYDFYASPRLNHANDQLCWQAWKHPNMPWDGNELWLCDIDTHGSLSKQRHIAGSDDISVFQPSWSPDDVLHYIADDDGWWQLYRYQPSCDKDKVIQLTSGEKEFGLPQWVFAQSHYAFIDDTRIICSYQAQGVTELAMLSLTDRGLTSINTPWTSFDSIAASAGSQADAQRHNICFIAASGTRFPQLVSARIHGDRHDQTNQLDTKIIRSSCEMPLSDDYYSSARTLRFSNRHQQSVYANYYAPTNPEIAGDQDMPPPMIVICHGGPTGQSSTALDPKKQFWTSRGFALLDVNYSGSTGYGRRYRQRLDKQWGKLDVEDCCDAALHAVAEGLADKNKLIIRGSSAGGFTVLAALTFEDVFSAGASYYGISDLSSLADDTHKFEKHYTDRLVGPYPESEATYRQRSPLHHTERMNCPVIFFQGNEDRVVPKEQAEMMYGALSNKGLPVAAQYYESEQHGFRQADTIKQSLENELRFYQLIFDLRPRQQISFIGEIETDNL